MPRLLHDDMACQGAKRLLHPLRMARWCDRIEAAT